jgi:rhodanese-related sulfurtransferase
LSEARISIETWKRWQAEGRRTQLVDVRSATEFVTSHLPGAVNIPLEQIEMRGADLDPKATLVLVCQAGNRSTMARKLLAAIGNHSQVLEGGTDAWLGAGYPVVRATASRWALERQVRLIAGLMVAAGVALGVFVSSWWLTLPAFVGCGLAFAGATNFCAMGEILARLPWNRPRQSAVGAVGGTPDLSVGTACAIPAMAAGTTCSISAPPVGSVCSCELPKRP